MLSSRSFAAAGPVPGKPHPPGIALELLARRFALLAEPMRLRLIHALLPGEKNVGTLVAELGTSQANTSRHLQALAGAHIVARRRQGPHVFYALADRSVFQLCELACGGLERQLTRQARTFVASKPG